MWVFTQKEIYGRTQNKARLIARYFLQISLHTELTKTHKHLLNKEHVKQNY